MINRSIGIISSPLGCLRNILDLVFYIFTPYRIICTWLYEKASGIFCRLNFHNSQQTRLEMQWNPWRSIVFEELYILVHNKKNWIYNGIKGYYNGTGICGHWFHCWWRFFWRDYQEHIIIFRCQNFKINFSISIRILVHNQYPNINKGKLNWLSMRINYCEYN